MGVGRGGLPDTKRGGGQSTSGPIYEKWGGGGGGGNSLQVHYEKWGGGAIRFMSITKSGVGGGGGGGQFASGPLRKVGGGGGPFASGPLRKVGGGSNVSSPLGSGSKPQKLRKPGPAPHKRTSTLLGGGGGGGGGVRLNHPSPPWLRV